MKVKIISVLLIFSLISSGSAIYAVKDINNPLVDYDLSKLKLVNSVTIYCEDAVYIAEGAPTTNYNLINQNNLIVGGDEFGYSFFSLLKFSDITQGQGGLLPDEAELSKATLMVYMNETTLNDIDIKKCSTSYDENTVTWNSKPVAAETILTTDISLGEGWKSIELPISLVNNWIDNPSDNHGIYFQPSEVGYGTYNFRSDDYGGYQPKLVLQYTGADSVDEPEYVIPDDDIQCELSYTVIPENPNPGEMITITVTATDNVALEHVMIVRGSEVLAIREATDASTTSLTVSYSEVAELPSKAYGLVADDIGVSQSIWENVIVPVRGTDSEPIVTIEVIHDADVGVQATIPERYSFIEDDTQSVAIRATATDPEGIVDLSIQVNGRFHDYHYSDGRTTARETVLFQNTTGTESLGYAFANSDSLFSFSAYARDAESYLTTTDRTSFTISPMNALDLTYSKAPLFVNTGTNRLSWTRMTQVFGGNECWVSKDWNWKKLKALIFYHAAFKDVADGGRCFGFSTMVAELYNGRLDISDIQGPASPYELNESQYNTAAYLEARQAAQLGASIVIEKISQWYDADDSDAHINVLSEIRSDLLTDEPGVLAIREGGSGHALVPWMIREMNDGTTRIYVYDPNRTGASHNINADIMSYSEFPYLTLDDSSWSYIADFNGPGESDDEIWNDKIFYYSYSHAIGGTSDTNNITNDGIVTTITDHRIPTLLDALIGLISGDATMYMSDEEGRITGVKDGSYYEEIPGSMAMSYDMGTSEIPSMFIIPDNITVTAHISGGNEASSGPVNDGKYHVGLLHGESVFSMEDKAIPVGSVDRIKIEPIDQAVQYKMTFMSDSINSDCRIGLYEELPSIGAVNDDDMVGREFFLDQMSFDKGSSLSMYVEKGASQLILAQESGNVSANLAMRSTEILNLMDGYEGYIPESTIQSLTFSDENPLAFTPITWENTSENGNIIIKEIEKEDYTTASEWAKDEIEEAIAYDLTTARVLSNFQQEITREEFCEIVIKLYQQLSDSSVPTVSINPFTDTTNEMVLMANHLGIVKGVGNGLFAPNNSITREEICVMLYRTLITAMPEDDFTISGFLEFDDASQVSEWATDSVVFMNQNNIMKGVGNNEINPLGFTPREQAIILLKRTFDAFTR
ncbi:MAG TPA: DNRLRE domain-containing protein [Clostridia bacterium]|nr:DNRLRE domain-containing protein [Clostridia bacterium]